ncbi:MAG: M15 family metallopeptidase [Metallibacterium sp.]
MLPITESLMARRWVSDSSLMRHHSRMLRTPPPATLGVGARARAMRAAQALGIPVDYGHARSLRPQREPARLQSIGLDVQQRPAWLRPRAAAAFLRMRRAAMHDGIELQVVSAWRSCEYQLGIIRRKCEHGQDMAAILAVSAAPGYSEHHSGRALDLTSPGSAVLEEAFEQAPAFAWLQSHARNYGFALSYPRGNRHGIAYEPWHWCWHARRAR